MLWNWCCNCNTYHRINASFWNAKTTLIKSRHNTKLKNKGTSSSKLSHLEHFESALISQS